MPFLARTIRRILERMHAGDARIISSTYQHMGYYNTIAVDAMILHKISRHMMEVVRYTLCNEYSGQFHKFCCNDSIYPKKTNHHSLQ